MRAKYIRPTLSGFVGYVPGEQPGAAQVLKLNTNENPYPPSPRVAAAIASVSAEDLRRYPDPQAWEVRKLAAARYGLDADRILVGNGSDELLSLLMRTCVGAESRVAYPVPTYTLYDTLVAVQGGEAVRIPYGSDWALPPELRACEAIVKIVCHPNSPSGTAAALDAIAEVATSTEGLVVVDEAYVDFATETALPLLSRFENVVVLRTFSKSFSLAGLRIGLAMGPRELIEAMTSVKDSYNVNRVSLAAAAAALEDYGWMEENVARVRRTRERLSRSLEGLGFVVVPSQANFVFARRPGRSLRPLYEALRERGILIRHFPTAELDDGVRITVGTDDEIDALFSALRVALPSVGG